MVDTSAALTPQTAGYLPGMHGTAARCFRVAVPTAVGARRGESAGHFRLYALPGKARELCGDRSSVRRILTCPASWGEHGHSRAGCPGTTGFVGTGNGRARTGAVCARDAVGAENAVTLCDLGIFADQAADPVTPENPDIGAWSRRIRTPGRRALLQCPVRPVRPDGDASAVVFPG